MVFDMKKYLWFITKTLIVSALALLIYNCLISISYGQEYSAKQICDCIWIIEGGDKANQHYGINPKYIKCDTKDGCERICFNTVKNNRVRFKEQHAEKDFLTFLAKRYCPPNWKVWLKNLMFYLQRK